MEDLVLNQEYKYTELQFIFNNESEVDPNMEWTELGEDVIGKGFIVVDAGSLTLSFILSGYIASTGAIYKLIYKA